MNVYRITGTFEYLEFCSCDYCEGHKADRVINICVQGRTPYHAAEALLGHIDFKYEHHDYSENDVLSQFTVEELPEDQRLARTGAPSLFPLEPTL